MGKAIRWTGEVIALAQRYPGAVAMVGLTLMLPSLLWGAFPLLITNWLPPDMIGPTTPLWLALSTTVLGGVFVPFVCGTYSAAYGVVLDGQFRWADYRYGLRRPIGASLTFFSALVITIGGLILLGGAASFWSLGILAVGDEPFPRNLSRSIRHVTENITTVLDSMGTLVWLVGMVFMGISTFWVCNYFIELAGDFKATLFVLLTPIIILSWFPYPIVILAQCIGIKEHFGFQGGPYAGRLGKPPVDTAPKTSTVRQPRPQVPSVTATRTVACPVCGTAVPREARFCPECRSPI